MWAPRRLEHLGAWIGHVATPARSPFWRPKDAHSPVKDEAIFSPTTAQGTVQSYLNIAPPSVRMDANTLAQLKAEIDDLIKEVGEKEQFLQKLLEWIRQLRESDTAQITKSASSARAHRGRRAALEVEDQIESCEIDAANARN
ncbi:hypothetical protein F66182_9430 [Fusarium sp. NRRL 66182]|nr:hypothetical protein F66182_9430 [Fusarium sp. NRRL 66182]